MNEIEEIVIAFWERWPQASTHPASNGLGDWLRKKLTELVSNAEERGRMEAHSKDGAAYDAGMRRGQEIMKNRIIACVPPIGYSSVREGKEVVNMEARGFNKCRHQILAALSSLSVDE